MSILRTYQRQAIDAAWRAITPETNRVAIEMATGLGKTITFAALIDEWLDRQHAGTLPRALVLVHTDELVRQAMDKIRTVTRNRWSIGVVKADRDETNANIIVASVQTLARPERRRRITDVGLIVVDECHHATAQTYREILDEFGAFPRPGWAGTPTFGFTATLARSDGTGLGQVWQDLAFSRSLPWAIRQGWLTDLVPYTITVPELGVTKLSDVVLDEALCDSIAPEAVVRAWADRVNNPWHPDRGTGIDLGNPSTVLFAPLVRSAEAFAAAFSDAGVKAEVVHGALPAAERKAILDRYEAGTTTVICNAMVLTEGWDSPRTSCVIVARPTQSVPLFVQMAGRGLRPWLSAEAPPREDQRCVLLCVAGATTDLVTVADLSEHIDQAQDGKSLLAMEDEWDLGRDIVPDEMPAYAGPVRVEQWDALVQRSSKAWRYTLEGVPFLPTARRGQGYVFIVEEGTAWSVWERRILPSIQKMHVRRVASAPDLELAMALAEDEAQERGGDIGALLADKTRAWRKKLPSPELTELARRAGVPSREIEKVLTSRAGGKAGKLSDLTDRYLASRVLDGNVKTIRERART